MFWPVYESLQCIAGNSERMMILVTMMSIHYNDVTMSSIASQITSLTIVYSAVYSGADQRKHQSSASLAFVRVIHRGPVNSPHKWPVTRKMFPFDDVIMLIFDVLGYKVVCGKLNIHRLHIKRKWNRMKSKSMPLLVAYILLSIKAFIFGDALMIVGNEIS